MPARHLVVGLDGFDLDVVRTFGPSCLPTLHRLMKEGAFAASQSVLPPATLPNWATFLTGSDPGQHGVFDFTTRDSYSVKFTGGTVREVPTLFSRLDRLGMQCACLHFPGTWPPEQLEHGVFISGWDAPVAFEADPSFVWPPALYDRIKRNFGPLRFDEINEFHADSNGWVEKLPGALCEQIEKKTKFGQWLLHDRAWDVFAIYFGQSDTAGHYLWSMHDSASPRRPAHVANEAEQGLRQVYQALDKSVGALIDATQNQDVEITIVSDHGFGGSSDKVLYLNRVLEETGLLRFHKRKLPSPFHLAKSKALTLLPPRLREKLFTMANRSLPNFVESQARFGQIDMQHTVAFSDELNYFPAIHLNMEGREKNGTVQEAHRDAVIALVERSMLTLVDPWNGQKVIKVVHRREAIYDGNYVDRAPDLLLEFELDEQYSYNLMPSGAAPHQTGPWRKLCEEEPPGQERSKFAW